MITIHTTPTTVILTPLRDHPFAVAPEWWVFSFSGSDTGRVVQVVVQDESTSPSTFQRFTIEVDLRPLGLWYYSLWSATGGTVNDVMMTGSPWSFGLCSSIE